MRVMVTSGPTRAWIDRVRYIANTSSGALGARIVEALTARGMAVLHVRGTGSERPAAAPPGLVTDMEVETIDDLIGIVRRLPGLGIDAVVHAMAVLDYVPERALGEKKSSGEETWDLQLVRTPKVTALIRDTLPAVPIVGFKLEAGVSEEELVRQATASLDRYGLACVVANDIDCISPDRHEALLVGPGGAIIARCNTKSGIAARIADLIVERQGRR